MIDPAALGTLMIGLEGVRRENGTTERASTARMRRRRPARWPVRSAAAALRWLADTIEGSRRSGAFGLEG
jgi:hypothetical protein